MGSRVRALAAEQEPLDAVAMMIDGQIWSWMEEMRLFLRLKPGTVPEVYLSKATQSDLDFLRTLRAEKRRGPALPVAPGDAPKIGGALVDPRPLRMVEKLHPAAVWGGWRGWFVGRDSGGELVAVWKMPEGYGYLDVAVTSYDGDLWGFNQHMFVRLNTAQIPAPALADMRKHSTRDPGLGERIADALHGALPASVEEVEDTVRVGGATIPREQYVAVVGNHGRDVEWLWSTNHRPVVARRAGKAVGLVCPLIIETQIARGQA